MRHSSIKLETPIEFINVVSVNPLISKCEIKVCWVGENANRNRSIITKEVATQMANSLPGSPIVGYFNEGSEDFEEHNRSLDISNGMIKLRDTTKPYGFVDLNAKVWFQKFLDDGLFEREYLMTEGWLWTGQYPECQRIIDKGNNQSMELADKYLDAFWTEDNKGNPQFFIINEAIISKLCILGDDCEPCFEGATITAPTIQFSLDDSFKQELYSMMNELKELLNKGGEKVFSRYNVEIGDTLWTALYNHVESLNSQLVIDGVFEEENQVFAVVKNEDGEYSRINCSLNEDNTYSFAESETLSDYTPSDEPQFSAEAVAEYAKKKNEDKKEQDNPKNSDDNSEEKKEEDTCPECGKPKAECTCEDEDEEEDKKKKYSLEDVVEYSELLTRYNDLEEKYNTLENNYNALVTEKEALEAQMAPLSEFKANAEKKQKEEMINSFYMLSDEDKADVIANIDTYSLDDIEAKLSILCVRNKVSFNLDEEDNSHSGPTTFSLDSEMDNDANMPAWVKAALNVAKTMQ